MRSLIIVTLLSLTVSCSPEIRVYSDHDPDYQLAAFGSFNWARKENIERDRNPLHYNELNDKRIKTAVREQLTSRGYVYSEEDPDLLIHYHIIVDDQAVIATEPYGYYYGPYWTHMRTSVYSYREGTLIIDLMDPRTSNLVWRGWATAAIDMITPEQTEVMIRKAVSRIFKRFPVAERQPADVVSRLE